MKRGKTTLQRILLLAALCGLSALPAKLMASPAQSPWFAIGDPVFAAQNPNVTDNQLPSTFIQHGNVDCSNLSFTKRNGAIIPPLLYSESQISGCFLDTTAGEVLDNGFMDVPGTPYVAETVHPDHSPYPFFAFPGSDVFVSTQSGAPAIGNYVWLSRLTGSIRYTSSLNGKIWAEVTPVTQTPITDAAGNLLPVLLDNMVGSSDGKWAVVDSPGHGILRINLETMEVLPFQVSLENGDGTGSAERIAISGDGRFVAVASKAFHYFRIFDLSTCDSVPSVIGQPINCQSQDLDTYFRSKVSDLGSILQMRFITNDQLKIYASYDISSSYKTGQFALAAPGTTLAGMQYLGMGDSFSSGEGSQSYEVGTDDNNNKCHLSTLSYPYLIAKKLSIDSFHSVACSGAMTYNVGGGSGIDKDGIRTDRDNQYRPTYQPAVNGLGAWLPGYSKQIKFVSENQPQLITLSVIGNDLNFGPLVKSCAHAGTCYPTYEDRLEVFKTVDSKLPTLTNVYKKLKSAAPNSARIYAVGYPQIALSTGNCGANVHMSESELTFAGELIGRIDAMVKTAASQAGVYYADVEDAFNGHRLCEATAGSIAMNGLTAGSDIMHVIGNESFHPNAFGQFLLAQKILNITNNLGIIPDNPNATLPPISDENSALKNVPKTGRTIKRIATNTASEPTVAKAKPTTAKISGHDFALQPNTAYTITTNGVPSGSITSGNNGDITIQIPTDTAGTQTVTIDGQDVTNQPVSITTTVDVLDPDNPTACGVITASGQDIDKDGQDDACDPNIGPPPAATSTPSGTTTSGQTSTSPAPDPVPQNPTTTSASGTPKPTAIDITAGVSTQPSENTAQNNPLLTDVNPASKTAQQPQTTPQQTPETKSKAGKVLGEATTNLSAAARSTKQGLLAVSAAHPMAFSAVAMSLLFGLLALAYLHYRFKNGPEFQAAYR
ncbi:MAG: hypothetical protein JWO47_839 [Candidatus Saccharibacteria bacterium]|nr:hypothetical protein [Candidatus Saccharibacteria bacterium]